MAYLRTRRCNRGRTGRLTPSGSTPRRVPSPPQHLWAFQCVSSRTGSSRSGGAHFCLSGFVASKFSPWSFPDAISLEKLNSTRATLGRPWMSNAWFMPGFGTFLKRAGRLFRRVSSHSSIVVSFDALVFSLHPSFFVADPGVCPTRIPQRPGPTRPPQQTARPTAPISCGPSAPNCRRWRSHSHGAHPQ